MATQPQAAQAPQVPSNISAAKQAVFDEARAKGRQYGKGKTARLELAELAVARSRDGLIGVDDAERMWQELMQGSAEATKDVGGDDPKDTKQRAGDLKNFIMLGANKELDGNELFDNAKKRMADLRSSGAVKNARVWELMLAFARKQNEEPQRALSDAEIDKIMADKANADRDAVEIFWGARMSIVKANEGNDYPEAYEAASLLEKLVKDLGGTRKQRREAAKAEAKKLLDAANAGTTKPKPKKKGGNKNAAAGTA